VLELGGSLSVALVAVAVGLRLASGGLDLRAGLYVLVLAPEAYQPLRSLAAQFHASADGAAAADEVFAVLDRPAPDSRSGYEAPPMGGRLVVDSVSLRFPGTERPVLHDLSFTLEPGEVVALVGPSGCGKSTVLSLLLRFREPDTGRIGFGGRDLAALDPDLWRTRVAWVPQRPYLFARSLRDNITLGRPCAAREEVLDAVAAADLRDVVRRLPDGLDSPLGERGHGLSVGERQRVALARAFLVDAPLLLLDEPTANLDGATEESVLASVRLLSAGRSVLVAAHRPALVALADRMVELPVGVAESIP
jgi:ABC-type transport system involved in cytochrome bd biosynthesis fused ATPase/permease subunit